MDLTTFRDLLSDSGQEVLRAAEALNPRESDFLRHFTALSRRYPPGLARAALETAILREQAAAKFPHADQMYFTREALEQASSFPVSSYRSARFRPFQSLADLGCSIGGDTLALAGIAPVIAIDLDSLRLAMAQANLRALGLDDRAVLVRADLSAPLPLQPTTVGGYTKGARRPPPHSFALFFDPARRAAGRRIFSVKDYQPPLEAVQGWLERFPALGVKISPGVDLSELAPYPAEIEFISLAGEMKEAVLWFGPLKTARRRATLLPGPHTLTERDLPQASPAGEPGTGLEDGPRASGLPLSEPRAFLYEPDPAVLRAHLVAALGARLEAAQLDPDIAYLTADKKQPTPFARVWAVEGWFPFNLKRLRAYLRERKTGRVVVKKRGSPLQPESLIRDLRLSGDQERVVFLTHLNGRPVVVVCLPEEQGIRG